MFKEENKELKMSNEFRKKIEMICKFACVKYELVNGNIISIKNTNLAYVRPHILKVKGNDYLLFEDNQTIDILNNPFNYLSLVSDWITLPRKEKQRIISHYIDSIDIERHGDDFKIININFLSSFITEQQENHNKYDTPLSLNIFQSSDGYPIRVNPEFRTNEQARKYFDKLDKYMNSKMNCKLNYYYVIFDCNIMNGTYPSTDNEAVIRAILIEDKKLRLDNKLKIGVITIDVSEMKKICTPKVYGFIMKACEEYKKDFKNFISKIPV